MAGNNGPKIVTRGLVLALDAADKKSYSGSGTAWNDLSGNNNNGTLTNGPTFSSANGGSIVFDGTNDYVNLGTTNLPTGTNSRTINLWTLLSSNAGLNLFRWIFYYGNAANGQAILIGVKSTTNLLSVSAYGVGYDIVTAIPLSLNTWYNITSVYNGTAFLTYLNSSLVDTTNLTINTVNNTTRIGNRQLDTDYFNGNVANVTVYNRALSASEILQNFNATRGRFNI